MTPDEQQLIQDLFVRLGQQGAAGKDRAAETLILQELRRNPDAAYLLVQTAIVYEHQLGELENHIRDLEQQLQDANRGAGTRGDAGSFLGGRLGPSRAAPQENAASLARVRSGALDESAGRASPWSQQPAPAAQQGGGFFRSAMATAAGVAGGMMLGDGLRGLFGGGQHDASGQNALADADRTQDELQDQLAARDAELAALDADDDAAQDADFGGDDSSLDV